MPDNTLIRLIAHVRSLMRPAPNTPLNLLPDPVDCARLALINEFGSEPSNDEIAQLLQAVKATSCKADDFFDGWDFEEEASSKEHTTGGGHRINRKPGLMGG